MGRLIFVIEEKVLFFFFTVPLIYFLISSTRLLKIKVSVEPCLVSVMVLMRGCSVTDEYEAVKETIVSCYVCNMVPRMGNETLRPLGVATGNALSVTRV